MPLEAPVERRAYTRFRRRIPATLTFGDSDGRYDLPGLTRDLTWEGTYVVTASVPPLQGTFVRLRLGTGPAPVELTALVVHRGPDGLGLMFRQHDARQADGLAALL